MSILIVQAELSAAEEAADAAEEDAADVEDVEDNFDNDEEYRTIGIVGQFQKEREAGPLMSK